MILIDKTMKMTMLRMPGVLGELYPLSMQRLNTQLTLFAIYFRVTIRTSVYKYSDVYFIN